MTSLQRLNPSSEAVRNKMALAMTIQAGKGMQEILKTNLGPRGTMKLLVSGGGDLKVTKDGKTLLHEMQIQHPTAALIARTATSQDDMAGDGTTSVVLLIGELLKQAERYLADGVHPRALSEGFETAKALAIAFLEKQKVKHDVGDRELLLSVARTSLRSKIDQAMADQMADIVVDAVTLVRREPEPIDLFMVEVLTMQHRSASDTQLVRGLVLDHGGRHPDMPKTVSNAKIMILNVSLEYEKTTFNSTSVFNTAEKRDELVESERRFVDDRVRAIIELKRTVCAAGEGFVIVNQKGIDPMSLDMLAKAGILALRRAKRRNMERLMRACGGTQINAIEDLDGAMLGSAGKVYEHVLGEEKYTFIEDVKDPFSCTVLIRGPNAHTIAQIKDTVRDGLRAVKNAIEDGHMVPGAGAFEVACARHLRDEAKNVRGKPRLGVLCFADALLVVPKTLAENSGFDPQDTILVLEDAQAKTKSLAGLNLATGDAMDPAQEGVWDNFKVKRQALQSAAVISAQLLLVDEIMKAGKEQGGGR